MRDLMTVRVVSVRADEPISAAVQQLTRFGFSALPVVSASYRLVGMVSLLDVLRYREAHEAEGVPADERVPVEEIMNPDVVSMAATAKVAAVAQRLRSHGELRVMPVVQGGKLVGVVTRGDLLRHRDQDRPAAAGCWRLLRGRRRDQAEEDALFALARAAAHRPSPVAGTPVREVMTQPGDHRRLGRAGHAGRGADAGAPAHRAAGDRRGAPAGRHRERGRHPDPAGVAAGGVRHGRRR